MFSTGRLCISGLAWRTEFIRTGEEALRSGKFLATVLIAFLKHRKIDQIEDGQRKCLVYL
jgi:hypothetical protein